MIPSAVLAFSLLLNTLPVHGAVWTKSPGQITPGLETAYTIDRRGLGGTTPCDFHLDPSSGTFLASCGDTLFLLEPTTGEILLTLATIWGGRLDISGQRRRPGGGD